MFKNNIKNSVSGQLFFPCQDTEPLKNRSSSRPLRDRHPLSLVAVVTKGLPRSQEWIILWDVGTLSERRRPVCGGWSMKVCAYECLTCCTHARCWSEGDCWCLKKMHRDQHQWVELVCSFSSLPPSLLPKLPLSSLPAVPLQKQKTLRGWIKMWETTLGRETRSRCRHALVFTVHFLLSNGPSNPMCHCNSMGIKIAAQTCIFFPSPATARDI